MVVFEIHVEWCCVVLHPFLCSNNNCIGAASCSHAELVNCIIFPIAPNITRTICLSPSQETNYSLIVRFSPWSGHLPQLPWVHILYFAKIPSLFATFSVCVTSAFKVRPTILGDPKGGEIWIPFYCDWWSRLSHFLASLQNIRCEKLLSCSLYLFNLERKKIAVLLL